MKFLVSRSISRFRENEWGVVIGGKDAWKVKRIILLLLLLLPPPPFDKKKLLQVDILSRSSTMKKERRRKHSFRIHSGWSKLFSVFGPRIIKKKGKEREIQLAKREITKEEILATPFFHLSFQILHGESPPRVITSLWWIAYYS